MIRRIATAALAGAAMPVLAVAGCLSTPPYQPETRVSYAQDGTGATVAGTGTGTGFELHFASGSGFHFPDALKIDGTDILGHDPTSACDAENESGFAISPTPRISADSGTPGINELKPVLRGPAVVQVKLAWTTRFECSTERAPGGTSTFTVFPDGRIVRHDVLADSSSVEIFPSSCACPGATGLFTISSYWTFASTAFTNLFAPDRRGLPMPGEPDITNLETACFTTDTYQVTSARGPSAPVGSTAIHARTALIVLGYQDQIGIPSITSLAWDSSTALFIEHSDCGTAIEHATEYPEPSTLMINDTPVKAAFSDGIYGGDSGGGPPGFPLDTNRAMLTGPVKSSFAVRLRFPSSVDAVRARLAGQSGPWYVPQQVDDRTWIVWFRDPLLAGQTIVVEPF